MLTIEEKLFAQPLSDLVKKLFYYRRLERTWHLVESNYSEADLSLEQAARASGTNKNHLNVLLRQTTTFTFHQILVRYRLLKAVTMMSNKNYSLLEIALENGFGSLNTFERNFRSLIGLTPKEFKSRYRFDECYVQDGLALTSNVDED